MRVENESCFDFCSTNFNTFVRAIDVKNENDLLTLHHAGYFQAQRNEKATY